MTITAVIGAMFFVWLTSLTGPELRLRVIDGLYIALTSLPWALLWLASATGFGLIAKNLSRKSIQLSGSLTLTCGIAILLLLDAALGSLGLLQFGGTSASAWIVIAIGILPLLWTIAFRAKQPVHINWIMRDRFTAIMPGAILLLLAACSAPGWLWDSEFGGYDVLSYHLQLPKEWCQNGAILPFDHNIYSFLPSYMESAYYHLMVLRGDSVQAVYACQMLHAALAIATAITTARLIRAFVRPVYSIYSRLFAGFGELIILGTPWVIVTGSLAYNELPTALMLAASLCLIVEKQGNTVARAALLGLFMAIAVGCKPTSAGLVALPLLVTALWKEPKRLTTFVVMATTGLAVISPWLWRNYFHSSNPTFPFLSSIFGTAHWSAEQLTIWNNAHQPHGSIAHRLTEAFQQLFRYGIGPKPDSTGHEPWQAQWSILPWLALAGGLFAATSPRLRRPSLFMLSIIALQLVFLVFFTHIKSRFMLPMIVPSAVLVTLGLARLLEMLKHPIPRWFRLTLVVATLAWLIQPTVLYYYQSDGAPAARIGDADLWSAHALTADEIKANADIVPAVMINRVLDRSARILLVGESAPLYLDLEKIVYCTVWDRGPMSRVIADHPADSAQWIISLREDSFTHVLLDPVMLTIWRQSGWSDPALDPIELQKAFDQHATLVVAFPNGQRLYQLK